FGQMAEEDADLFLGHFALSHLTRHAVSDRVGLHFLVKASFFAQQIPKALDGFYRGASIGYVALVSFPHGFEPRQQGRSDRNNRAKLLVLPAAGRIEIKPAMRLVELLRTQIKDRTGPSQRIASNDQEHQSVARFRCIE